MASVPGSRQSEIFSSDEIFDQICGLCDEAQKGRKEATHFCQDCQQMICDTCRDNHRALTITSNHVIVPENQAADYKHSSWCSLICSCSTNQQVDFYCATHEKFICSWCQKNHVTCRMSTIQEESWGYRTASLDPVIIKTKTLEQKYDRLKKAKRGHQRDLKLLKEDCKEEIKAFRKEVDTFLDTLEENMLAELDQWETDEYYRIEQSMFELTAALKELETKLHALKDAKMNGGKEIMYIADVRVTKTLQVFENRLDDLNKGNVNQTLAFQKNSSLAVLQKSIDSLGTLKKEVICSKNLSKGQLTVRSDNDQQKPIVTGCVVMPDGRVVVCDNKNSNVKILNAAGELTEILPLSCPWDVSVIDNDNVIISSPPGKQLQFVQVFPVLKPGLVIKQNSTCWGVEVSGGEIYVACDNWPDKGEVRVLDLSGTLKRILRVNQEDGAFMFTYPSHITVNQSGKKIIVSDFKTNTITCLTLDGRVINKIEDDDLKRPHGLCCNSRDEVFVCDLQSNTIQTFTADGKKGRILLSGRDGLRGPHSVAYREADDTLVVGGNNLQLYKFGT